jgi:hypothetical protein
MMRRTTRTKLGHDLRSKLARKGMTATDLCFAIRIHPNTLYSILRGRHYGKTGAKVERWVYGK